MAGHPLFCLPRRFSLVRLSPVAARRLRGLSLTMTDIQYTFTFGARIHLRSRTAIVLRRRDFPPGALALTTIARREGIVLLLDRHGLIQDIWRDRNASRTFWTRRGRNTARPRPYRRR